MGEPVVVVGSELAEEPVARQRQFRELAIHMVDPRPQLRALVVEVGVGPAPPLEGVGCQRPQRPTQVEVEREGAALVGPAIVVVGRGQGRGDRLESRGAAKRGLPLRHAAVGCGEHADLAGRPALRRRPGDGVDAVVALGPDRIERSLGFRPPARVLDHDGIARTGGP
jgi:hypothetical protein